MATLGSTIGERIRELRNGWMTQAELATAAGVSVDLVRKLEQGQRHTASVASLARLARALDVDMAALLAKPTTPPNTEPGFRHRRDSARTHVGG